VKQNLYLSRNRVDSTEVWAFVQIAAMASEREVFDIIAAAMLTGDNVVRSNGGLRYAPGEAGSTRSDLLPCPGQKAACRHPPLISNPGELPPGLEPEDWDKVRGVDQGFVLGSLVNGELALVCEFTQQFYTSQQLWIDSERH
jgi:hypothetical protein